jgi:hypothetical protein
MASCVDSFYVPRFDTLHWVPLRCRRILPLSVLKQYQCIVVGATQEELTVAFVVRPGRSVIAVLSRLTGRDIFPILAEPDRIQLLIQRIELYNQHRHALNWPHYIHWFLVRSIIVEYTQPQRQMCVPPDKQ